MYIIVNIYYRVDHKCDTGVTTSQQFLFYFIFYIFKKMCILLFYLY